MGNQPNRTYAGAVRAAPRRSNPSTGHGRPRNTTKPSSNLASEATSRPLHRQQHERVSASTPGRVPVDGARRLWGYLCSLYSSCYPKCNRIYPSKASGQTKNQGTIEQQIYVVVYDSRPGKSVNCFGCRMGKSAPQRQTKWSLERCYMSGTDGSEATEVQSQVQTNNASDATSNSSSVPPCSEPPNDSPGPLHDTCVDQDALDALAASNPNNPSVALNWSQSELPEDPNPMATAPSPNTESGSHFLEVANVPPL